jgi:ATP-dependent DNA helicase RecQ
LANYLKLAVGGGEGISFAFDFSQFVLQYQLDSRETWNILKLLEQDGWIYMTDGFFQSSRTRILVDREVLYDYQLRNIDKDALIKLLLRLYQGILSDTTMIQESGLAKLLYKGETEVVNMLRSLQRDGIIEYIERSEEGRLTMLRERVHVDNFMIDQTIYQFRKKRRREGIDQILAYIETFDCRQRFLLHYFDDQLEADCGVCDRCKAAGRQKMRRADYLVIKKAIFDKLQRKHYPVRLLIDEFDSKEKNWVVSVLQYLLNEESIIKYNGIIMKKSEDL